MEAIEDMAGTFDSDTGRLALQANLKITVETTDPDSTCTVSPVKLNLSTEIGRPWVGERFAGGLAGPGALSARWFGLPAVEGGFACAQVEPAVNERGGIWMAQHISSPRTCADEPGHPGCAAAVQPPELAPVITEKPDSWSVDPNPAIRFEAGLGEPYAVTGFLCALDRGGRPFTQGEFEPCDSGTASFADLPESDYTFHVKAVNGHGESPVASYTWTVGHVDCGCWMPPRIARVTVKGPKRVRKGRVAKFRVRVGNSGDETARKVTVIVRGRRMKGKRRFKMRNIPAQRTVGRRVKVRVTKPGKVALQFTVKAQGAGKRVVTRKLRVLR